MHHPVRIFARVHHWETRCQETFDRLFQFDEKITIFQSMVEYENDISEIIEILGLEPLPQEGGYFKRTYEAGVKVAPGQWGGRGSRPAASAIYYLITPVSFSSLHRLRSDEMWHFYAGDPVEQLLLHPHGGGEVVKIGTDWSLGCRPQTLVPAEVWQGTRLMAGGRFALIGNTVHPGFEFEDYEHGIEKDLLAAYPAWSDMIKQLINPEKNDGTT